MKANAFVLLFLMMMIASTVRAADDEKPTTAPAADEPQEIIKADDFAIASPRGWRENFRAPPQFVTFRQGDGIGVPKVDETKVPLQVGLTVERFRTNKSLDDIAADLDRAAKTVIGLKPIGERQQEKLKLADGADALLITTEFMREGRHTLQLKLVAKNAQSNAFIVSAYAAGGKDSTWPTPASALAQWLRGHVLTFVLDPKKIDPARFPGAFDPQAKPKQQP